MAELYEAVMNFLEEQGWNTRHNGMLSGSEAVFDCYRDPNWSSVTGPARVAVGVNREEFLIRLCPKTYDPHDPKSLESLRDEIKEMFENGKWKEQVQSAVDYYY